MLRIMSLLCLLIIGLASNGQRSNSYESELEDTTYKLIDSMFSACTDSNPSTIGISDCYVVAANKWGEKMNYYYNLLLEVSDTLRERQALQNSQKCWIRFTECEEDLYRNIFDNDGTMWQLVRRDNALRLVRTRALQLQYYYETLTQH